MMDVSDPELALALMEQRPEAPSLVLKRFSPLVRNLLKRGLGASSELDDVQQEVFMCVFRRIDTLRNPLALRGFVVGIALNTVLYERRRRKRRNRTTLEPEPARLERYEARETAVASFAWMRLEQLLCRLRERERKTFVLRFIEGRTTSEVAALLGLSEPTARRSFSYAWGRVSKWAERDPFLNDYFGQDLTLPMD